MKATVNGISTYYEIHGREGAPWLTFSHSLACSVRMWDGQIAAFKDRYRILVYDTRGHSGSAAPAGAYTLELLAEDLLELLKKLEIARTHFVGLSMGGGQSLNFGLAHLDTFAWVGGFFLGIPWLVDVLWPLWEDENRALHDLIVKSHVVQA